MSSPLHVVVIGAGPGGYVAAFHAADLGLQVTLLDNAPNPGGVCLYRGCIPSKALLHAAKVVNQASEAKEIGIEFNLPKVDLDKLRAWKNSVVTRLTGGLGQLTKQRRITYVQGDASFVNASSLTVKKADGTVIDITFDRAIIATGSRPITLPFLPKSGRVWDSTSALELSRVPASLLIIGGGYIGLELGSAYAGLGTKVSVVEALPSMLAGADRDLADVLIRRLKKSFTSIMTGTKVLSAVEKADGIEVTFQDADGKTSTATYDQVLSSVGRRPNTDAIGLDKAGVTLDAKGFITVDVQRATSVKTIYAIGDVAGQPMLAHKASYEAKVAAEAIAGKKTVYDPKCIPAVVFTDPELAWTGLTEQETVDRKIDVTVFKFPWAASGRAMTLNRTDGITKIIADKATQRILGVGIVGAGAGDLISEGALAIEMGAVAEDLALTIHPHPTLSEMLMETAEGLFGHCTHILRPKK